MVDDKLYRLTIPGAVFVFMFVGWLVSDSSIGINDLLPKLEVDNTTKLTGAIFSGGFLTVVVGYICGELGLAMKLPDSNIQFAPQGTNSDLSDKNGENKPGYSTDESKKPKCLGAYLTNMSAIMKFLIMAEFLIAQVFVLFSQSGLRNWLSGFRPSIVFWVDMAATVALVAAPMFTVYFCLVNFKECISAKTKTDDVAHFNLWRLLHTPTSLPGYENLKAKYNLEALSIFTHGRISNMDKLYSYISRAWGRIVIGSSSFIATLLAFQTYWITRILVAPSKAPDLTPVCLFLLLNLAFTWVLRKSIVVQQDHRVRLYELLLWDPRTGLPAKRNLR